MRHKITGYVLQGIAALAVAGVGLACTILIYNALVDRVWYIVTLFVSWLPIQASGWLIVVVFQWPARLDKWREDRKFWKRVARHRKRPSATRIVGGTIALLLIAAVVIGLAEGTGLVAWWQQFVGKYGLLAIVLYSGLALLLASPIVVLLVMVIASVVEFINDHHRFK